MVESQAWPLEFLIFQMFSNVKTIWDETDPYVTEIYAGQIFRKVGLDMLKNGGIRLILMLISSLPLIALI